MSRITPLAALTLLALTPAPPAAATNLPIDDFEVLPFDVAQNGPGDTSEVQFVPPAWIGGHLAATTREIVCAVGPTGSDQSTTAILNTVGPGFDSAAIVNVPPTGHASLVYELGYSANLTVGGTVDRLEAAFTYPSAAQVTAVLVDENQSSASFTAPRPIGGPTEFPLAAFGGVDVENIVTIRFDFDDPGIYACYAIRLRGEGSVGIDFEIHEEATFTPPLPSAPLTATLFLPDTAEPIFDLALIEEQREKTTQILRHAGKG